MATQWKDCSLSRLINTQVSDLGQVGHVGSLCETDDSPERDDSTSARRVSQTGPYQVEEIRKWLSHDCFVILCHSSLRRKSDTLFPVQNGPVIDRPNWESCRTQVFPSRILTSSRVLLCFPPDLAPKLAFSPQTALIFGKPGSQTQNKSSWKLD